MKKSKTKVATKKSNGIKPVVKRSACQWLNDNGDKCKRPATKEAVTFGSGSYQHEWFKINLCDKHFKAE